MWFLKLNLAQIPLLVPLLNGERCAAETEGKAKIFGLERKDSFSTVSRKICVVGVSIYMWAEILPLHLLCSLAEGL